MLRALKATTVELEIPDLPLINDLHRILVKCKSATIYGKTLRHSPGAISERVRINLYEGLFIFALTSMRAYSFPHAVT